MNVAAKIETPPRVNISDAARAAMNGAATYREGAERLLEMARNDAELMTAIVEPWELRAAMDAIQKCMSNFRARTWHSPDRQVDQDRVQALIQSNREMLLDFPLPGGIALRHATRPDVEAAAGFYGTQASDMAHKSRWLLRIARKVPAGKTVGEAFDNVALAKLQEDTRNG